MFMSSTFSGKLAEPIVIEPALAALDPAAEAVVLLPLLDFVELPQAARTSAASTVTAPSAYLFLII
jgi:hypothetical protein